MMTSRSSAKRRRYGRGAAIAGIIAACTAAVVLLVWSGGWMATEEPAIRRVVDASAVLPHRTFASRLEGSFGYKPLVEVHRGEVPAQVPRYWRLYAAADEATRNAANEPRAANLHALGVAELLLGNHDKAVSALERALITEAVTRDLALATSRVQSAALLNDLTCAYLARAASGRDSDYLRALPLAERAWRVGRSPASAWNRALTLQALGLNRESADAWDDLLSVETSVQWRTEALEHRRKATTPTVAETWAAENAAFRAAVDTADARQLERYARAFSSQVALIGFQQLSIWAVQAEARPDAANTALRAARLIGTALAPDDRFLDDAVKAIDESVASRDASRHERLLTGMRHLNAAKHAYDKLEVDEALQLARKAAATLQDAGSCLALAARTLAASCLVFAQRYEEGAVEIAHNTTDRSARHRYRAVYARSEWIAALCFLASGRPYEALQGYATAKEIFTRAGDRSSVAGLEDLEGEAYEHLGLYETSWQHRRKALLLKAAAGDRARTEAVFGGAARAAVSLGQYDAAVRILDSVIALKRDEAFASAELLVLRGAVKQRLGRHNESESDLRNARAALSKLPPGGTRDAVASDIRAVELIAGAPTAAGAAAEADAAIAAAERGNNKFRLVPLLRARAAATTAGMLHGNHDAERDMESALNEMQTQLAAIRDANVRLMAQQSLRDLYSSMIRIAFDRRDYHRALWLLNCERARTRAGRQENVCRGLDFASIPRDTTVIDYSVAGDDIYAFRVRGGALTAVRLPATSRALETRAGEWLAALRQGDDRRARELGAALHAELVEPVLADTPNTGTLVIAGSPSRSMLPFAALWSRRTGRYLVEETTIVYVPSLSHLLEALERDATLKARHSGDYDLLTVAPAYAAEAPPFLPRLPAAEAEVRAIGALYGRVAANSRLHATSGSFSELAGRATVVHFAGHSILNEERPRYSALAFSNHAATREPDMLYAHDIAESTYSQTRLIVLASCSSAATSDATAAASASLAAAFLDAGVSGAVATFWPIVDRDAAKPLVTFHRQVAAGVAAPVALRQMQLAALRSGDPHFATVRTWAPYGFTGWHSGQ